MAEVAPQGASPSSSEQMTGPETLAQISPLWQLNCVAEVPRPRGTLTELPERAAALSILPALLAANAVNAPLISAWIRTDAYGPVAILTGGFDVGAADQPAGLRRLAAPAGALATSADGPAWAALLGLAGKSSGSSADGRTGSDSRPWQWFRHLPVFDPIGAELVDEPSSPGLSGALRGSIEDCFELFAAHPMAWLVHAGPVDDAVVGRELDRLAHLMPSLRNKAGSAESHQLALQRAEAWYREISAWRPHGWWQVEVHVGAPDRQIAHQVAAALTTAPELRQGTYTLTRNDHPAAAEAGRPATDSAIAGDNQPRGRSGDPSRVGLGPAAVALTRPPVREVPGVRVVRTPRFDLTAETSGPVTVGEVLDANLLPCGQWSIPLSSLNRHVFVCGATGSGKSQTIRTLLEALSVASRPIPWLVIEPAKAEYAGMAGRLPAGRPGGRPAARGPRPHPWRPEPLTTGAGVRAADSHRPRAGPVPGRLRSRRTLPSSLESSVAALLPRPPLEPGHR